MQTKFNIGDEVNVVDVDRMKIYQSQKIKRITINQDSVPNYSFYNLGGSAGEEFVFTTLTEAKSYLISELTNKFNADVKKVMGLEEKL